MNEGYEKNLSKCVLWEEKSILCSLLQAVGKSKVGNG